MNKRQLNLVLMGMVLGFCFGLTPNAHAQEAETFEEYLQNNERVRIIYNGATDERKRVIKERWMKRTGQMPRLTPEQIERARVRQEEARQRRTQAARERAAGVQAQEAQAPQDESQERRGWFR